MRSLLVVSAAALSLMGMAGCEANPAPSLQTDPPAPASTTSDPAGAQSPAADAGSPTAPRSRVDIKLSNGVVLSETVSDGTVLNFSVDYQFVEGEPGTSDYFLVIDRASGPPATEFVRLGREGTLPVSLPGWTLEEGPFRSHLEDQDGHRVSDSIRMRRGG